MLPREVRGWLRIAPRNQRKDMSPTSPLVRASSMLCVPVEYKKTIVERTNRKTTVERISLSVSHYTTHDTSRPSTSPPTHAPEPAQAQAQAQAHTCASARRVASFASAAVATRACESRVAWRAGRSEEKGVGDATLNGYNMVCYGSNARPIYSKTRDRGKPWRAHASGKWPPRGPPPKSPPEPARPGQWTLTALPSPQ
jgi:hypothetical protein